eukprot:TRINITY_DN8453_c0_g1_i2.p1 TRINITY_DN8453_c0_g1~~TRINITY_DN8453_c0_g1_i2.p1  ORF type:complete len:476 (+),score=136.60 TRINITY_DN8453_c0_g1_i2:287-1714(+)
MEIERKFEAKESTIRKLSKSRRTLNTSLCAQNSLSLSHKSTASKSTKPLFNYKSTMCPLGSRCPNDCRPRWPSTETASAKKLGHGCPYAHHYSEVHFAQEDATRARGIERLVEGIRATIEVDEKKAPWVPGSNLRPCTGCGIVGEKRKPCNSCQLRELTRQKTEKYKKATEKSNKKLIGTEKQKSKEEKIKKQESRYIIKLGLLKKANVLINSERWGDAFNTILQAVKIIKEEKIEGVKYEEERERKLRQKLKIPADVELDYTKLMSEPITEQRLHKLFIDLPVQTVEIFMSKLRLENPELATKNNYLNEQILELYETLKLVIKSKKQELSNLKNRRDKIEAGDEDQGDKKRKYARRALSSRRVMCSSAKKKGSLYYNGIEKCSNKSCELPHSAIELDFQSPEVTTKNLQSTIKSSTRRLLESKAKEPWRPVKSGSTERRLESDGPRSRSGKKWNLIEQDLDQVTFASFFEELNK